MSRTTIVATSRHQNALKKNHKKSQRESKKPTGAMQYALSFLILLLTAGISVGQGLVTALNIDTKYLTVTLVAIVVSLLTAHRNILYILLVVGMSATVNLPEAILVDYGINKTILLVTLIAIITEPLARRFFK
jgi:hypothetical protein